jgi:hypothetical protein
MVFFFRTPSGTAITTLVAVKDLPLEQVTVEEFCPVEVTLLTVWLRRTLMFSC